MEGAKPEEDMSTLLCLSIRLGYVSGVPWLGFECFDRRDGYD